MEFIRIHRADKGPRKHQKVVTECIIKHGKRIACGIAICSKYDKFDDVFGAKLARRRALRVIKSRKVMPAQRGGAVESLLHAGIIDEPTVLPKARFLGPKELKAACEIEKHGAFTI